MAYLLIITLIPISSCSKVSKPELSLLSHVCACALLHVISLAEASAPLPTLSLHFVSRRFNLQDLALTHLTS